MDHSEEGRSAKLLYEATGSNEMCRDCRSNSSHFGEPLDCVFVLPADGSFPSGRRLGGYVKCGSFEASRIVREHQVEIRNVDMSFIPVDQRNPVCGDEDVAGVGVAMHNACPAPDEARPGGPASGNGLRRHRGKVDPGPGLGVQEVG